MRREQGGTMSGGARRVLVWALAAGACLAAAAPASAADTSPPTLEDSAVTPETVNVAYATQTVTARLRVKDETGAEAPRLQVRNAATSESGGFVTTTLVSGTPQDGWWEGKLELTPSAANGAWEVGVSALRDFDGLSAGTMVLPTTVTVGDERVESGFRWRTTGSLAGPRAWAPATRLGDGRVLVTGGKAGDGFLGSAELYDPATGEWAAAAPMSTPRHGHTATRLRSGRILVAGGLSARGSELATAEIFTPATGTWAPAGSLGSPRYGHTATVLADGRVLVAGGSTDDAGDPQDATAEIFDPATGRWTATGSMATGRGTHTANLLPDGRVLVAGGCCISDNYTGFASAELFDPATGTWRAAARPPFGMVRHSATSLPDGRVLVVDGSYDSRKVAMYNPATKAWTLRASHPYAGMHHTASLLPSGKVFVAGRGYGNLSAQLFDPASNRWTATGGFYTGRAYHSATVLTSGKVLLAGGSGGAGTLGSSELVELDMKAPAVQPPSTTLPVLGAVDSNGRVPLQVGVAGSDAMTKAADLRWTVQERFESAGTWSAWASILSRSRHVTPGRTYQHQARATDEAGNVSAYVPGPADRVRLEQETAAAVDERWQPVARTGASGGSVSTSSTPGATLRFPFTARRAAAVLPLRADLGLAKICIDAGTPAERCALRDLSPASGLGPRKLVVPFNVVAAGTEHVMSVTVYSGRVDVDGLALVGG